MIAEGVRAAVGIAKPFEGFSATPYLCPAGVPSIGFGTTHYPDGTSVTLKDQPITRAEAERIMLLQLYNEYLPGVIRACPGLDTVGRVGGILDFGYNCGLANLRASTLRKKINAGQWDEVPAQLLRWKFAAGKPLRGLLLRRMAEARLI